jgi:hypothetical protein
MSGINTFTSAGSANYTIIDTGTLQISADANLGATPSSATSNISLINGGALLFSGQTAAFSLNSNRLISLGTGGGKIANNSSNYAVTIAGSTSGSGLTIGSTGNTGTVILSGPAATGYGGVTTVISGATLNLKFDGTPTFNSSAYTGAGTVILEPVTAGGSIALGGSGSTLNLPVSLSNKFTDPLTTLIIGGVAIDGSPNSGNITITGANSFVNAISVVSGGVEISGQLIEAGTMVVFLPELPVTMTAKDNTRLMILGGEPLDGPRHLWWNFVSTVPEKLLAAQADWAAAEKTSFPENGRFKLPPKETEFIPLPKM